MEGCPFCREQQSGREPDFEGEVIWQDDYLKVILLDQQDFLGYCRVIPHDHYCEFSEMDWASRQHLMEVVDIVEKVQILVLNPAKVNLASLGNRVNHVHWHVVPRYEDDSHFPNPIWGESLRVQVRIPADQELLLSSFKLALVQHLTNNFTV